MKSDWLEFEEAVAEFCSKIDPNAKVTHDVREPDPDHSGSRQRDVIVLGAISGISVRILISCKRYKRKLSSTDIEHFHGELFSANADKGCLFSYSGYSKPAIKKAKSLGIDLFTLLTDEPNRFPDTLTFWYLFAEPKLYWQIDQSGNSDWVCFVISACDLHEFIEKSYSEFRSSLVNASSAFPIAITQRYEYKCKLNSCFDFVFWGVLDRYLSRQDAVTVNGRYCFTSGEFVGSYASPAIDTLNPPGIGWDKCIAGEDLPPVKLFMAVHFESYEIASDVVDKLFLNMPTGINQAGLITRSIQRRR